VPNRDDSGAKGLLFYLPFIHIFKNFLLKTVRTMPSRSIFYNQRIRRILIRSANWVGDALMTTPAIHALRKHFPGARITLLAKPWVSPVFYRNPHIDELLLYKAAGRHAGLWGKWRLSQDLKKKQFDLAVLFPNSFESALIVFLAGIRLRLGYATDARTSLLTHRVYMQSAFKELHQIGYYLKLLEKASISPQGSQMTLRFSATENRHAIETLQQYGITGKDVLIGINPGAQFGTAKRWLPDRYAALSRRLNKHWRARSLIFGSPGEKDLGQQISRLIGKDAINFCGKTNLRQAMTLIAQCQLFITNDSGLMHVAAALDIPQVAIIGPTNPQVTGPASPRSRIIRKSVACSPCLLPECPIDHRCMERITVDSVYEEVVRFANTLI
jgi:heptosyltransferase-2